VILLLPREGGKANWLTLLQSFSFPRLTLRPRFVVPPSSGRGASTCTHRQG
jgi:hypothetical protein